MSSEEISDVGQPMKTYTKDNPHPLHGIDDNIINEQGHTKYPMYVHEYENNVILKSTLVNDEKHHKELFPHLFQEEVKSKKKLEKPDGWDKK